MELFEAEKERNNKLLLQFEEDKENSSKWVSAIYLSHGWLEYHLLLHSLSCGAFF